MKVFLGGTVNGSKWRTTVKEQLNINYFDPVVDDWTDAAYERELAERRFCDYVLYVLTPKMTGYYAIAEVTDDSYHRPDKTIFCYLQNDLEDEFSPKQIEELNLLREIVEANGAVALNSIQEVINFLNSSKPKDALEETGKHDAFISYGRRESQHFSNSISNRLSEIGYNIFRDLNEIPLIIESEEYVLKNILNSDNFIYIVSPNTVRSEYCDRELEFAIKYNKRIIPVLHRELGTDSSFLDDIVAKKAMINIKDPHNNINDVVNRIKTVIKKDEAYVNAHSKYLFQAKNWDFNGRKQADLLYGKERKKASLWLNKKSDELVPLRIQLDFIEASKKISLLFLPILWLNKKTYNFTHLKWFDKTVLIISLINPIAMMDQIRVLVTHEGNGDNSKDDNGVSLPMWVMLFGIHVTLVMAAIKDKDLRLFLSAGISGMVSSTIILILLFS